MMHNHRLANLGASTIQTHFTAYHHRFKAITARSKACFERRDWSSARADAAVRLSLYGQATDRVEGEIRALLDEHVDTRSIWSAMKRRYADLIRTRKDRELAETFFNSVSRRIFATVGVDPNIEFVSSEFNRPEDRSQGSVYQCYFFTGSLEALLQKILRDQHFEARFADPERMVPAAAGRIRTHLGDPPGIETIEVLTQPFFRARAAYLVGRIVHGRGITPLVIALHHLEEGLTIDAVIMDQDAVSILFSFTRAYFHVLSEKPSAVVAFLMSILPRKRVAELYTAIGYHKHGKTELYRDILTHTAQCGEDRFEPSPGQPGLVMIVFNMPNDDLVVKLIRDRFRNPKQTTRQRVMQKYDLVFKHDRAGRLVEAHPFEHLKFERCWFSEALLEKLLHEAGQTVHLEDDHVVFEHVFLQRRVIPLDVYLHQADRASAESAVIEYGNAIKDMAVSNIFPGDMLLKNFGVTRHGRVVFYDYDELSLITRCNFRKLPDSDPHGAELFDEPWYFVDVDDVFPEEFARFLGLSAELKDVLMRHHGDLFDIAFWLNAQEAVRAGTVPHILPYDAEYRLHP
jgi:isocitrate dehydrogenase kinase/phosphatase